jgi:hypothetical protein
VTKHSERPRDFDRMSWCKLQRCLLHDVDGAGACEGWVQGVVDADHAGERAGFHRAPDDTVIPLCARHHRDRTCSSGYFAMLTRAERLEWRLRAIEATQAKYAAHLIAWHNPNALIPF